MNYLTVWDTRLGDYSTQTIPVFSCDDFYKLHAFLSQLPDADLCEHWVQDLIADDGNEANVVIEFFRAGNTAKVWEDIENWFHEEQ